MVNAITVVHNAMGSLRKPLKAWRDQGRSPRGNATGDGIGKVTKHPSYQIYPDGHFREKEHYCQGTCERWDCVGNCFLRKPDLRVCGRNVRKIKVEEFCFVC